MRAAAWTAISALMACGGCALLGYDFDRYQPATSSGVEASGGAGGDATSLGGNATAPALGGHSSAGGAADVGLPDPTGPIASTLGAGGAPLSDPSGAGGESGSADCGLLACIAREAECGAVVDGCGDVQLCGSCFWWLPPGRECRDNVCVIPD